MSLRDLLRTIMVSPSLNPAARVTGTATGSAADLRGYDAAVVVVSFGAVTDGTHTPSLQHSVDGTTYTACASTDLDGSFTAATNANSTANTVQQVGYIGTQRYLQVVLTTTGATTGAVSAATIIAGCPRNAPTQQIPS